MPLNQQPSVLGNISQSKVDASRKSWEVKVSPYPITNLDEVKLLPPSQPCLAKRRLVEDGEIAGLLDEFGVEVEVVVEAAVGFRLVNLLGHEQVRGVVVALGLN